jgi:transposase
MSKPLPESDTFRRIEVLTGTGRRRRWPDEVKEAIIAETLEDGAVVSEVARRHGVAPNQVFTWRKEARQRALALTTETAAFAPVVLEHQQARGAPPVEALPSSIIEIEIDGAKLRIPMNASRDTVFAVIEAIGGLSKRRR